MNNKYDFYVGDKFVLKKDDLNEVGFEDLKIYELKKCNKAEDWYLLEYSHEIEHDGYKDTITEQYNTTYEVLTDKFYLYDENDYDDTDSYVGISEDYVNDIFNESVLSFKMFFDKCTVVACKLPSGFVIVEHSACVDQTNYDENIGIENCIKKIKDKIRELESYRLQYNTFEDEDDYFTDPYNCAKVGLDCATCPSKGECL